MNATDVAGKVKFTLKRNGTKIRSAIVDLNAKDKAKKVFANISKPGTYLVVARYLGSETLKRSKGRVKLNFSDPERVTGTSPVSHRTTGAVPRPGYALVASAP